MSSLGRWSVDSRSNEACGQTEDFSPILTTREAELTWYNTSLRVVRFEQYHLLRHLIAQIIPLVVLIVKHLEAFGRVVRVNSIPDNQVALNIETAII